ncbi:MAG: hypothetical protein M3458_09685 [Acidobacteriota bacterium]|nr:hypothetical protein [Acidobacteriota bacterium]
MKQRLLLSFVSCLLVVASSGCGVFNPSIRYVLPDGYTGVFQIILDKAHGKGIEREGWRYTYEIPPNGILRVKSFEPLYGWHQVAAAYKNGSRILIPDSTVSDDTIALRDVGMHEKDDGSLVVTILIGTQQQADKVRRDKLEPWFDEISPAEYSFD